ncbi:hypothetical protein [Ktedonospora formicarum]|uniref:Uncharacterized protein n=1 Tax=Ktedonospora formicarum TaxID=2778364 RepID=A0A8J3I467_9CHLR|nr:hypothetical protein [Ktedonospora formicarum]GHO46583.1 hypothetical protein KSX_47460 [Ktedonospora formicarum]
MGKEHFDASVGLGFSLTLFERYRKNGLLQAELTHVPGIRGRCKGFLQLVEGKVTTCYVEDKDGRRHQISPSVLVAVDNERGPFDWHLMALPTPPSPALRPDTFVHVEESTPIPRIIAPLDIDLLRGWTSRQKLMLSTVYETINGMKDIETIKKEVPLAPNVTEEAIRILLSLQVVSID